MSLFWRETGVEAARAAGAAEERAAILAEIDLDLRQYTGLHRGNGVGFRALSKLRERIERRSTVAEAVAALDGTIEEVDEPPEGTLA